MKRVILGMAAMAMLPAVSIAQFMRLGPFDLDASTSLSLIYTTNVEGQRKSEAVREREDYYLVWGIAMTLYGPTTPTSELNLNTAMSIEKHFVRDDLDNASDPFGNAVLTHDMELGRFELPTTLSWRRENTVSDEESTRIYFPGQQKDRIVRDTRLFSQGLRWQRDPLSFSGYYTYRETRFQEEEFQSGDENRESLGFGVSWDVIRWGGERRLTSFYNYSRQRSELVNDPEASGSGEWEITQSAGLRLQILTKPDFSYALAYRKDEDAGWRPTHTFSLRDNWDISPTMVFDYSAIYVIDQQARDDEISFVYSVGFSHDIDPSLRHSIRATREPVETFGSTSDTDSTTVAYRLSKSDLFFADITLAGGVVYARNEPQGPDAGPVEETWTYTANVSHSTAVSRRLERRLSYNYRYQTSNLFDEYVDEHRVMLTFTFSF